MVRRQKRLDSFVDLCPLAFDCESPAGAMDPIERSGNLKQLRPKRQKVFLKYPIGISLLRHRLSSRTRVLNSARISIQFLRLHALLQTTAINPRPEPAQFGCVGYELCAAARAPSQTNCLP